MYKRQPPRYQVDRILRRRTLYPAELRRHSSASLGQKTPKIPVSYTHLDVYKRQDWDAFGAMLLVAACHTYEEPVPPTVEKDWDFGEHPLIARLASVSYTHLDVYKRQPSPAAPVSLCQRNR